MFRFPSTVGLCEPPALSRVRVSPILCEYRRMDAAHYNTPAYLLDNSDGDSRGFGWTITTKCKNEPQITRIFLQSA
jgi:hypothetical protein